MPKMTCLTAKEKRVSYSCIIWKYSMILVLPLAAGPNTRMQIIISSIYVFLFQDLWTKGVIRLHAYAICNYIKYIVSKVLKLETISDVI
uniref:Uncharacterized protein n=1 Tax=Oryza brachyantha TaxID=4533 RepID=J3NB62_ORYBR